MQRRCTNCLAGGAAQAVVGGQATRRCSIFQVRDRKPQRVSLTGSSPCFCASLKPHQPPCCVKSNVPDWTLGGRIAFRVVPRGRRPPGAVN
ncbi:hypothetical protein BD311DRAFT_746854 [Dichomitus squalens]|uniref:Uncharacterized protein n=1 Tax=Dichomitus squalens TaxID=114155 RepID=A0A4Q9N409_9APHY|nr:hypothetical protein BD311DRAFT_746854 [Dichomitus squalens]